MSRTNNINVLDEIVDYSEQIISKKIIACKKHVWACERFMNDLETSNFDYQFDIEKAQKIVDWMECFKHRKGVLAGKYIQLMPIQKFVYCNVYGWYRLDKELRRFIKAYWQVARKNAKSQGLAGVGLYEISGFGEQSSEVYCAATKKEQSKIVWDEARWMVQNSEFKDNFRIAYSRINHDKSDSFFRPLSKDDRLSGDGLNPQAGIIDEYHAHTTSEYYDILDTGMGARANPLMFIITTAGAELANPCYRVEYEYVSNILNPMLDVHNNKYFVMINELDIDNDGNLVDDIEDESCWIKANPIVATYDVGRDYLREQVKVANDSPEKLRNILTKNFNVWVNWGQLRYMDMEKWKVCQTENRINLKKRQLVLGIDLSATIDLSSVSGVCLDNIENGIDVFSHSFIPECRLRQKIIKDRVPYDLWLKDGWLTTTKGEYVDYAYIKKWIKQLEDEYECEILEICYDKWNATQFAVEMEDDGYEMVEVIQGIKTMSEPTKKFRAMVLNKEINHDRNPLLTFAMNNAVVKADCNENIMLDKSKAIQRIDPVTALMTAFTRCVHRIENSCYDDRKEGDKLFSY